MAIVECRGLCKEYKNNTALFNIDLSLFEGRIVGILGPNGAGKTTLLKILAGLLVPEKGSVAIGGYKPGKETKAMVAYLPDRDILPGNMEVREVMKLYEDFYKDFNRHKAEMLLEDMRISGHAVIRELSKGTREKVQLILCMSRDAKVYILDEPIGGVDPSARDYILKTILQNYNPDALVIIATHLIAEVESILDDVVFLKQGSVILYDEADHQRTVKGMSINEIFKEMF